MSRLLRSLLNVNRQLKIRRFGNVMSWSVNLRYLVYDLLIAVNNRRRSPVGDASTVAQASTLRTQGFAIIDDYAGSDFMRGMAGEVNRLLAEPERYDASIAALGIHRLRDSCVQVESAATVPLLPRVAEVLHAYFGGPYGIYSSDIYRTFPVPEDSTERLESLKWHFDNGPRNMVKLFVYLSDTQKDSGAVTVAPRAVSARQTRQGRYFRDDLEVHADEITSQAQVVEGALGTILLFTPQLNAHKATLPLRNHRDAAVFLIHPVLAPRPVVSEADRRAISNNFGYMVDPFRWKPLRVGDQ